MRRLMLLLVILMLALPGLPLRAQDLAALIADRVEVAGNDTLVASGGVEVLHKGNRLKAQRIVYDRGTDRLVISGPIVLTDATGDNIILADQADLSGDLTDGILTSARLVLNQQLQLAATEIMRIKGRYTALGNTVASSCRVCATNPTPLWEIRAARVIHDELERQIFFDRAQMRVAGMPIFYLPRLRIPDPTLDRATGFLAPTVRTTSGLGTGLKVPYFIRIGDHADLTLTPYLSSKNGRTLELRYRQAFRSGRIEFNGAIGRDDLLAGQSRHYGTLTGQFDLPHDYKLALQAELVSDPAYLLDYGISDKDRLDSRVAVTRTQRNEHISGRLIHFNSIRAGDINSTLPSIVTDFTWQRRFSPRSIGGEGGLRFQSHSHYRSSDSAADSDGDGIADGRDLSRVSLTADWRRNWVLPAGVIASAFTEITADAYDIRQDAVFAGQRTRLSGGAGVELRWPLLKTGANGVAHMIEPVVQAIWSPKRAFATPNEDSVLVEFDESNLFSFRRFPGSDAVERGPRLNLGLGYTRSDPAGWSLGVTAGRVIRPRDPGQFGVASGLAGASSDWLLATRFSMANGASMTNRLVFDNGLDVTKAELRFDMQKETYGFAGSYIWMLADPTESRTTRVSELTLDGRYTFAPGWQGRLTTRYDFEANRAASAGLNLEFRNECLKLDMTVSRRFTSSAAVKPTTDFGLSVDLLGIGGKSGAGPARACRG